MRGIKKYFKEVGVELSKVTWPKKDQVIKLTLIVFIISGAVAVSLGTLDFAFTKLLEIVISR